MQTQSERLVHFETYLNKIYLCALSILNCQVCDCFMKSSQFLRVAS